MAADAPLLSANDFTDEQWARFQRIAGEQAPTDFARQAFLTMLEQWPDEGDGEPVEEIDAEAAAEPAEEQEEPGEAWAPALALGPDAALLERLDRLVLGLNEVKVWAKTVLSELYAHTGFADAETERQARAKALEKFAKIEKAVAAELGRSGDATVN